MILTATHRTIYRAITLLFRTRLTRTLASLLVTYHQSSQCIHLQCDIQYLLPVKYSWHTNLLSNCILHWQSVYSVHWLFIQWLNIIHDCIAHIGSEASVWCIVFSFVIQCPSIHEGSDDGSIIQYSILFKPSASMRCDRMIVLKYLFNIILLVEKFPIVTIERAVDIVTPRRTCQWPITMMTIDLFYCYSTSITVRRKKKVFDTVLLLYIFKLGIRTDGKTVLLTEQRF